MTTRQCVLLRTRDGRKFVRVSFTRTDAAEFVQWLITTIERSEGLIHIDFDLYKPEKEVTKHGSN